MPTYPFENMLGRGGFDQFQGGGIDDRSRGFSTSSPPGLCGNHSSSPRFDYPSFPSAPLGGSGWRDDGGRNIWPGGDYMDDILGSPNMQRPGAARSHPGAGAFQRCQNDVFSRMYDNFVARPNPALFDGHPSCRSHLPQNCPHRRRLPTEDAGREFHLPQDCPNRRLSRGHFDSTSRHMPYAAPSDSMPRHMPHAAPHAGFEDGDGGGGIGLDRGMPPAFNGSPWDSYERLRPESERWTPDMWQSGDQQERTGF